MHLEEEGVEAGHCIIYILWFLMTSSVASLLAKADNLTLLSGTGAHLFSLSSATLYNSYSYNNVMVKTTKPTENLYIYM